MKKNYVLVLIMATLFSAQNTNAQSAYMGEIRMFAGNFAPVGWAMCDGQLLNIAQNNALFSLLGVNYGGNGTTTFALPDLRGRVPVHSGAGVAGQGLSYIPLAYRAGTTTVSILTSNLPAHVHYNLGTTTVATTNNPSGAIMADTSVLDSEYGASSTYNVLMAPTTSVGSNIPISIMPPYIGINFIICTDGLYPMHP